MVEGGCDVIGGLYLFLSPTRGYCRCNRACNSYLTVGALLTNILLTLGALVTNIWLTVGALVTNIGEQRTDSQPNIGEQSTDSQPNIGEQRTDSHPSSITAPVRCIHHPSNHCFGSIHP